MSEKLIQGETNFSSKYLEQAAALYKKEKPAQQDLAYLAHVSAYEQPLEMPEEKTQLGVITEVAAYDLSELAHGNRQAPLRHDRTYLPGRKDESLPYLYLGAQNDEQKKKIFYVPGFSEGPEGKAPFGIEMAKRGYQVLIPGQNRQAVLEDATNKLNASYTQALDYLAVIEHEGLMHESLDVVTHSYGTMVFEHMVRVAEERGWTCFDEAKVAMLAPAGTNDKENMAKLGWRFGRSMLSEVASGKDFPDPDGTMMKASIKNLAANIPRTAREMFHLFREKVDYEYLAKESKLGRMAIFSFAKDRLYPFRAQKKILQKIGELGIGVSAPVSYQQDNRRFRLFNRAKKIRGGDGATHNDDSFNPGRVAGAVDQFLNPTFA